MAVARYDVLVLNKPVVHSTASGSSVSLTFYRGNDNGTMATSFQQEGHLQGGLIAVEASKASSEKVEPGGRATDVSALPAVAKIPSKGEQIPGRKGVSSKLDAIREKYNPGEDMGQNPQRCVAQ